VIHAIEDPLMASEADAGHDQADKADRPLPDVGLAGPTDADPAP